MSLPDKEDYLTMEKSGKPADDCQPLGHGKWEKVSGVMEALLTLAAASDLRAMAACTMPFPCSPR
ncbi:MAG: hypothetical protein EHM79_16930 [Geobacter sp.]|nr:MAG: hypothetical protein EHM79_16930 [Geobacter sp.]